MAILFFVSSQRSPDISDVDWLDDPVKKSGHFVAYGLLAVFWAAFLESTRWARSAGPAAFILAVAFAASDEFHQAFTGRTSSLMDVGLDMLGAAFGLAVWTWKRRRTVRAPG